MGNPAQRPPTGEIGRDRQTDRQTDRETERKRERESDRGGERERDRDRQTGKGYTLISYFSLNPVLILYVRSEDVSYSTTIGINVVCFAIEMNIAMFF